MQKRGSPINRLPIMAKQVLDLFELYKLVVERGGLLEVINKKLWQEIIKGLHLPSSITSAAFTLRTQYMKYLYPFECEKRGFSTPSELQVVIDGNRREGRTTSFDNTVSSRNPMNSLSSLGNPLNGGLNLSSGLGGLDQSMSPLASLLSQQNNQQLELQQRLLAASTFGQMSMKPEMEMMVQYLKMIENQQKEQQIRAHSPDLDSLNTGLDMQRLAWLSMYQNNAMGGMSNPSTTPPTISKQETSEYLMNSTPSGIKRERPDISNVDDEEQYPHPAKKSLLSSLSTPAISNSFHDEEDDDDDDEEPAIPENLSSTKVHEPPTNKIQSPSMSVSSRHSALSNDHHSRNTSGSSNHSEISIMGGMQFNIIKAENKEVTIKMSLNGVTYEGVLTASTPPPSDEDTCKDLSMSSPGLRKITSIEDMHTPEKSIDENIHEDNGFKPIKLSSLPMMQSFGDHPMIS
ncbi:ARID3A.2 family protein [Megaselia abdita]